MTKERRRIRIIPLWREQPDPRLFALAVVELARQRLKAAALNEPEEAAPQEGADG
jgi:hypothetical protein